MWLDHKTTRGWEEREGRKKQKSENINQGHIATILRSLNFFLQNTGSQIFPNLRILFHIRNHCQLNMHVLFAQPSPPLGNSSPAFHWKNENDLFFPATYPNPTISIIIPWVSRETNQKPLRVFFFFLSLFCGIVGRGALFLWN